MSKRVASKNPIQNQLSFAFPEKPALQYTVLGVIKPSPAIISYSLAPSNKNDSKDQKSCVPVVVQNLKAMFPGLEKPSHIPEQQAVLPATAEVKTEMQTNIPDIALQAAEPEKVETAAETVIRAQAENKTPQSFAASLTEEEWQKLEEMPPDADYDTQLRLR